MHAVELQFDYLNSRPYRVRECTNPGCTTFGTTYWTANSYNSLAAARGGEVAAERAAYMEDILKLWK